MLGQVIRVLNPAVGVGVLDPRIREVSISLHTMGETASHKSHCSSNHARVTAAQITGNVVALNKLVNKQSSTVCSPSCSG